MQDSIPPGGIVYVLTNEAMPGLIKIGRTSGEGVGRRVAELSRATGVPLPFKVAAARSVHDAVVVERALHVAFGPDRVNPAREFFSIDPARAVAIIEAFPGTDMTPQVEREAEQEVERDDPGSLAAVRSYASKRRPPLNFYEMSIPAGSVLTHPATGEVATVEEARKVRFRGELVSLTRAQRIATGADYNVQPVAFWTFQGVPLRDIYEVTYPLRAED